MANYTIDFFGWCHSAGHDKIWGWISTGEGNRRINFWGARGKKYTFKRYEPLDADKRWRWERDVLAALCRQKTAPGRRGGTYEAIDPAQVAQIVPNFASDFEHQLTLALLFDKFHGEVP